MIYGIYLYLEHINKKIYNNVLNSYKYTKKSDKQWSLLSFEAKS